MSKRQRDKGKRGELEAAAAWNKLFGTNVRRSQQYCGRSNESDDLVGQPGLSIEVKRRNRLNVYDALAKALGEAQDGTEAVLLHRADRQPWLFTCRLQDLPAIAQTLYLTLIGDVDE